MARQNRRCPYRKRPEIRREMGSYILDVEHNDVGSAADVALVGRIHLTQISDGSFGDTQAVRDNSKMRSAIIKKLESPHAFKKRYDGFETEA
jgi:hypothetical protein